MTNKEKLALIEAMENKEISAIDFMQIVLDDYTTRIREAVMPYSDGDIPFLYIALKHTAEAVAARAPERCKKMIATMEGNVKSVSIEVKVPATDEEGDT